MKSAVQARWGLALVAVWLAQASAQAQTWSANLGVVSDYRFRGVSQTRLQPALQGGLDYVDISGWYLGLWGSNIRWVKDAGAQAGSVELDLYGGYRWQHAQVNYDLGVLRYDYVGNDLGRSGRRGNASTTEVALAATLAQTTLKYSHTLTRWLGYPDSQGSGYIEISRPWPVAAGWTLVPHLGYLNVRRTQPSASYTDYALTLQKNLAPAWQFAASLQGTNADRSVYSTPSGDFTGRTALLLGLKYAR